MFVNFKMNNKSRKASELSNQERIMVKRIIHASLLEQERGAYQYATHDAVSRAAFYTGLTPQMLLRIKANLHKYADMRKIRNTHKKSETSTKKLKLKDCILLMNTIDKFFTKHLLARRPTRSEVLREVEDDLPHYDSYSTKYLHVSTFINKRYHTKVDENVSRFRKEMHEIEEESLKRYTYLKEIREYRQQNRNIIYIDETWVDCKLKFTKIWEHLYDLEKIEDMAVNFDLEDILIILSAASKHGFIPEALKIMTAIKTESDTIRMKHFKSWIALQLLESLPKSSIIVVDIGLYHECSVLGPPTKYGKRVQALNTWLWKNESGYDFSRNNMSAKELYRLAVKQCEINAFKGIQDVLESGGHTFLELPAFMSKLNPFVLMWDKIKTDFKISESDVFSMSDVKNLIEDKISKVTSEDWKAFDEEVCKQEEILWTKDKRIVDNKGKLLLLYMEKKNKECANNQTTSEVIMRGEGDN